ncbi:MAG: ABC transporter permease [Candidatus Omnitrophica bacterium]|nr:ABC transporter permease [Candidatus Omnitrophota bacterium]MDD5488482.1 ABC transporter permease [Candidatus Omnitrophota bacterium]
MIELKNISKSYSTGTVSVDALKDVSLSIAPGEFVAIMGPSGSGKSTLLHVLGFLDRPESGTYKISGKDVTRLSDDELALLRNRLAGFVFQQFHLLRRVSALENTELPLIYAGEKTIREKAHSRLKDVGLAEREMHKPNELSGGEQQRVAIARALVNDPVIIFADEPTGNLDTKSEEEIMRILKALNDMGKTLIMVTHENEVAEHAKRIITMRDGRIVSDERKCDTSTLPLPGIMRAEGTPLDSAFLCKHTAMKSMELVEHVRQSFRAIFANKVRSFLSVLGILFGVAAVIAMLALGEGAKESIKEQLKTLGSNLLYIRAGSAKVHGVSQAEGTIARFTFGDVQAIRELGPVIARASGYVTGSGQLVYGSENWNTRIEGVGVEYAGMRASTPEIGRWFRSEEVVRREKVVILGTTVVEKLFGDKDPVGGTLKINRINFRVIGIAPPKGAGGFRDQDDVVYIPITTAMYRVLGKDYLDGLYVEVSDSASTDDAEEKIKALIIKRHRLYKNDEDAFNIRNMSEIQEMLTSTTKTMSLLLGCISAISLLVGGIGIMNIMLVSVTERTREIGLRKAIGARRKDIMAQFLIEAVVMTLTGGVMGIALGTLTAFSLSGIAGWATRVSLYSVILATTFSIAVGVGFGLWPARKASELNPIEALRYE